MIDARDLRIGSMFYPIERKGGIDIPQEIPFVVAEIFPLAVRGYELGKKLTQLDDWELISFQTRMISPIPITEELLLRAGFEKKRESGTIEMYYFDNGVFKFSLTHGVYLQDTAYDEGDYTNTYRIEIKYVHHLQNVVYDLTGQEITLKP